MLASRCNSQTLLQQRQLVPHHHSHREFSRPLLTPPLLGSCGSWQSSCSPAAANSAAARCSSHKHAALQPFHARLQPVQAAQPGQASSAHVTPCATSSWQQPNRPAQQQQLKGQRMPTVVAAAAAAAAAAGPPPADNSNSGGGSRSSSPLEGGRSELQGLLHSIPYKRLLLWGFVAAVGWQLHEFFGVSRAKREGAHVRHVCVACMRVMVWGVGEGQEEQGHIHRAHIAGCIISRHNSGVLRAWCQRAVVATWPYDRIVAAAVSVKPTFSLIPACVCVAASLCCQPPHPVLSVHTHTHRL